MTRRVLGVTAVLAGLLAPSAHAATASVVNGVVTFTAAPGESNNVTAGLNPKQGDANAYYFTDSGPALTAGAGCAKDFYDNTVCQMPGPAKVAVDLGDQDDRISISVSGTVNGGDGNDTFSPTSTTEGARTLDGGNGDDTFNGDGSGGDCFGRSGPASSDTLVGGAGEDTVDYAYPVTVTLDDQAGDGKAGENDNVRSDVEDVNGSTCPGNTITGSDAPNKLYGYGTLNGLGGNDTLVGGDGSSADKLAGGDGNDTLRGQGGNDALDGGNGDDALEGGFGDDVITGGPGTDSFAGDETATNTIGTGNDTINADDGVKENVSCGPGADVANVDALDVPAIDPQNGCETVNRSGMAAGPGPGLPTGPAAASLVKASGVKLVSKRRKLRITVTCNAPDKAGCNGRVTVFAAPKGRKRLTLASRTLSLGQGKRASYTLSIGKRGRSFLKHTKRKTVPLTVIATLRTSAGDKTVTQKLTVKR